MGFPVLMNRRRGGSGRILSRKMNPIATLSDDFLRGAKSLGSVKRRKIGANRTHFVGVKLDAHRKRLSLPTLEN